MAERDSRAEELTCTTLGHETRPANGAVRLSDTGTEHPYCGECIDTLRADNVVIRMWTLRPHDLFPPKGHRYLTDERIEEVRQTALPGDPVTLPAQTVLELVCDWRNANAE